jgi:hypothetical protein
MKSFKFCGKKKRKMDYLPTLLRSNIKIIVTT